MQCLIPSSSSSSSRKRGGQYYTYRTSLPASQNLIWAFSLGSRLFYIRRHSGPVLSASQVLGYVSLFSSSFMSVWSNIYAPVEMEKWTSRDGNRNVGPIQLRLINRSATITQSERIMFIRFGVITSWHGSDPSTQSLLLAISSSGEKADSIAALSMYVWLLQSIYLSSRQHGPAQSICTMSKPCLFLYLTHIVLMTSGLLDGFKMIGWALDTVSNWIALIELPYKFIQSYNSTTGSILTKKRMFLYC